MFWRQKFTELVIQAINTAQEMAGLSSQSISTSTNLLPIEPEHILTGLLCSDPKLFRQLSPGNNGIVGDLFKLLQPYIPEHQDRLTGVAEPLFSPAGEEVIKLAEEESRKLAQEQICTEHLLLGLLTSQSPASKLLIEQGFDTERVRSQVKSGSITPQASGANAGAVLMGKSQFETYSATGWLSKS